MKAIKDIVENRAAYLFEDILLCALDVKNVVEHETGFIRMGIFDDELCFIIESVYFISVCC